MAVEYLSDKVKLYIAKPSESTLNALDGQSARRMNILRKQRDNLLKETDWMGVSDFSITDAWKTYRQALRDITDQTPNADDLGNITFPTKPS